MSSPADPEKVEQSQPFLVEVSHDDSIGPSDVVPEMDKKRRCLFYFVYTVCGLFYLRMLSRAVGLDWPVVSSSNTLRHR